MLSDVDCCGAGAAAGVVVVGSSAATTTAASSPSAKLTAFGFSCYRLFGVEEECASG